jgi:ankyrin repeat protein
LHQAAGNGSFDIAKLLLEAKANPNAQQSDGNAPPHLASLKGNLTLVLLLLQYGTDPNIQNITVILLLSI